MMLNALGPQGLDENKLKALNETVARINRVAISSSAGLAAGATIGSVAYIILNNPVGFVLPGIGTVVGGVVGGLVGALWLVVDAFKRSRNKSQCSGPTP
jgi:hypothetical protein